MALEIMRSRSFVEAFINNNGIEARFMADGWDSGSNQLSIDDDLYDIDTQIGKKSPSGKPVEPTGWELYEKFLDRYRVIQDKKTEMITVTVEYYSPFIAREWSEKLVVAINSHMQSRKLQQVDRNIQYLEAQIENSDCRYARCFIPLLRSRSKVRCWLRPALNMYLKQLARPWCLRRNHNQKGL